jgi:hypothetical protein
VPAPAAVYPPAEHVSVPPLGNTDTSVEAAARMQQRPPEQQIGLT